MITLDIPDSLPAHTRAWLTYLDGAIAVLAGPNIHDRIEEAMRQKAMMGRRVTWPANATYFLGLYANLLNDQQFAMSKGILAVAELARLNQEAAEYQEQLAAQEDARREAAAENQHTAERSEAKYGSGVDYS